MQDAADRRQTLTAISVGLRVPVERDHGFRSKMITQSGGR
jgi:hypothetical protein